MGFAKMAGAALLGGSIALAFAMPANAAPLLSAQSALSAAAPSSVDTVQYRRWHGGPHHHHGYYGNNAGAVLGGLAAGAIIGGAIAAGQANAAAQQHAAYCAQRYRSYDPASNTFLARDGNRYLCQ
ncbi:MAG: BA14K family protein [Xanthobacteraceae bacterium]|nr:BA14K family protein [Xanthobacteraceae bacterium]